MDISNAIPENSPISVVGTDFSEIKNSEVIVISASTGTYVKSRTEMLPEQATMIRDIAKKPHKSFISFHIHTPFLITYYEKK